MINGWRRNVITDYQMLGICRMWYSVVPSMKVRMHLIVKWICTLFPQHYTRPASQNSYWIICICRNTTSTSRLSSHLQGLAVFCRPCVRRAVANALKCTMFIPLAIPALHNLCSPLHFPRNFRMCSVPWPFVERHKTILLETSILISRGNNCCLFWTLWAEHRIL